MAMTQLQVLQAQLAVAVAQKTVIDGQYQLQCDQNAKQQADLNAKIAAIPPSAQ